MNEVSTTTRPADNWANVLITGLAIGFGIATSRTLTDTLEASWGYWFALAAGLCAAAIVAGVISLIGGKVCQKWQPQSAKL